MKISTATSLLISVLELACNILGIVFFFSGSDIAWFFFAAVVLKDAADAFLGGIKISFKKVFSVLLATVLFCLFTSNFSQFFSGLFCMLCIYNAVAMLLGFILLIPIYVATFKQYSETKKYEKLIKELQNEDDFLDL